MDEFDFIRSQLAGLAGEGAKGLRDDCAYIEMGDQTLVISTDTSIEGVHFPKGMRGASAAERAVRVALSDIAAKGAEPHGYFVNLTVPRGLEGKWLIALGQGFSDVQDAFGLRLLGGDTTRHDGALIISVTVLGWLDDAPPLRETAEVGQQVWISGAVGDAALGLRYVQGDPPLCEPTGADLFLWEEAYLRPEPRVDLRATIRTCATASVDISDGVISDTAHIAEASGVCVRLLADAIPLSETSRRYVDGDQDRLVELLTSGDDYQVVICADPADADRLSADFTLIGDVVDGSGVKLIAADGLVIPVTRTGYRH